MFRDRNITEFSIESIKLIFFLLRRSTGVIYVYTWCGEGCYWMQCQINRPRFISKTKSSNWNHCVVAATGRAHTHIHMCIHRDTQCQKDWLMRSIQPVNLMERGKRELKRDDCLTKLVSQFNLVFQSVGKLQ